MEYQNYNSVPWYRKSGISSWFVLLGLFSPSLWIVMYALITGDIYYKEARQDGNLKKWSVANKLVAWIFLIPNMLIIIFFLSIALAILKISY